MNLFWSYSRRDNSKDKITTFKNAFCDSLNQTIGQDCNIFFDVESIKWGTVWKDSIKKNIEECDGFIVNITPSFFTSRYCIYELETAIDLGKKIFPIYYRKCTNLRSTFKEDGEDAKGNKNLNASSVKINEYKPFDFTKLKNKDIESEQVQDFLDKFSEELVRNCT